MSGANPSLAERTIVAAEQVVSVLSRHGVPAALIGAAAMASHGYPRFGGAFDLATDADPFSTLSAVARSLRQEGFEAHFSEPDAADPLGGVLTVTGGGCLPIQIVNFHNPWHQGCGTLAAEAMRKAELTVRPESPLRVVSLPYLIALKLFAGGRKSTTDVLELLERNRDWLDVVELRDVCNRHGLGPALEPLLQELGFA